mmetsp:Transcript_12402/g.21936  ORF Transcript_12402/g.21936 Transcript_12402/m.21936 type:complete len:233 (-) Transcript_12402:87-785(-)
MDPQISPTAAPLGPIRAEDEIRVWTPNEGNQSMLESVYNAHLLAWDNDPVLDYFLKSAAASGRMIERGTRTACSAHPGGVRLYTTASEQSSVVTMPYPSCKVPIVPALLNGFLGLLFTQTRTWVRMARLLYMCDHLDRLKDQMAKEHGEYIYVWTCCTTPSLQNRGLCNRLLTKACADADTKGLWMYLEATSVDNRRLYLRHGFTDWQTLKYVEDMPPMQLMKRAPKVLSTE